MHPCRRIRGRLYWAPLARQGEFIWVYFIKEFALFWVNYWCLAGVWSLDINWFFYRWFTNHVHITFWDDYNLCVLGAAKSFHAITWVLVLVDQTLLYTTSGQQRSILRSGCSESCDIACSFSLHLLPQNHTTISASCVPWGVSFSLDLSPWR